MSALPEFTVTDLATALKQTLEARFARVRVRGELSRVSIASSGHMYASLKDAGAVIDTVCWRGTLGRLSIKPQEGLEVICTGRITTYPARSNYQLVVEAMELAGQGALLKMLEDRRKMLAAEGLFAAERKRSLPVLPRTIGVVTSPTGAVIRDILHRLRDRFPCRVLVWPVLVQGAGAAEQVSAAIAGFNALQGTQRPDVIIVARGGGSLEDLMPFNEEIVVRAAAASTIPLIAAIGHETDTTLIDHAADRRAPTPTAAAEMAVPVRADLLAGLADIHHRLLHSVQRKINESAQILQGAGRVLGDPMRFLQMRIQMLDHLAARLRSPAQSLELARERLVRAHQGLQNSIVRLLQQNQIQVQHFAKMLQAYSFENILQRGFVLAQHQDGSLVHDPVHLTAGTALNLRFAKDISVPVQVTDTPRKD